jgi:hypothetical protein
MGLSEHNNSPDGAKNPFTCKSSKTGGSVNRRLSEHNNSSDHKKYEMPSNAVKMGVRRFRHCQNTIIHQTGVKI